MTGSDFDAVFWDIGGVILRMDSISRGHQAFVEALAETYGTDQSVEQAVKTWRSTLGAYFDETEGTEYRPARYGYERAVDAILTVDAETVDWEDLFHRVHHASVEPNPGAVETIQHLARTDLHQGVISDVDTEEGKQILETIGVFEHFDSYTSSEAVGRKKPDQAMFETALETADVSPERSVMIGDRYSHDMLGGREAGMQTIAYGADDGPAVDYSIDDLTAVLDIVDAD